jgi:hypothetical protein
MVFENGVKNIQAAAYNGTRTVVYFVQKRDNWQQDIDKKYRLKKLHNSARGLKINLICRSFLHSILLNQL